MNYKTERGNVDFFWRRFHALVKILSDYQSVTKSPVAASRCWTLTGAFLQWFGCAPAGVGPLEVHFAHPVRLAPDTHSQGHGRPCLQRLHPRRAFPATWFIFCDSFWIFIWYRLKRFPRTKHIFKARLYRLKRFLGTKSETDTSTSPFSGFRARETGVKEKKPGHGKPPQPRAH